MRLIHLSPILRTPPRKLMHLVSLRHLVPPHSISRTALHGGIRQRVLERLRAALPEGKRGVVYVKVRFYAVHCTTS